MYDGGDRAEGLADCFFQTVKWCQTTVSDPGIEAIAEIISKSSYILDERSEAVVLDLALGDIGTARINEMAETGTPIPSTLSLLADLGERYAHLALGDPPNQRIMHVMDVLGKT
jgi:hypothetical protein